MARLASLSRLAPLLIVFYLCFAGWFFILVPWSGFWTALVVPNSPWWMMRALESAPLRGALSGFGVLHFPVAAQWLSARRAS